MDPVSQGSLGGALAGAAASRQRLVAAACVGTLAGIAPDLDVLIRSSSDPLLFLEYHRQFTHALFFVPVGAMFCALVMYLPVRRWLGPGELYVFCLLGYLTHGLLDACTSYGTQLFWPFSDVRVAWNRVSVVDPLFTLPLLVLLVTSMIRRRRRYALLGLVWGGCYLALGVMQGWRAQEAAVALAQSRGHEPEQLQVKPSFGNLLVWKAVYAAGGWYYVDAVRLSFRPGYFPGERVPVLDRPRDLPWLDPDSWQANDLLRFGRFSSGYLAQHPEEPALIIDVRYSMVPNRIDGLWGIRLDPGAPDQHADFVTDRQVTPEDRQALWRMLAGPGASLGLPARGI